MQFKHLSKKIDSQEEEKMMIKKKAIFILFIITKQIDDDDEEEDEDFHHYHHSPMKSGDKIVNLLFDELIIFMERIFNFFKFLNRLF